MEPASKPLTDPTMGFKLAHELKPLEQGGSQWRVWLDVEPQLLDQVEQITYNAPPDLLPSSSALKSDRFSVQLGDGGAITVNALLRLKGYPELMLTHRIIPEPARKPDKGELIRSARTALLGESRTSGELEQLHRQLAIVDHFSYASELLLIKIAQDKKEGIQVPLSEYQTLAKYIYKDNSLSAHFKFDRALRELNAADDFSESDNCETLGLAAAIYKRKWQYDHQHKHLSLSRYYYGKGFRVWKQYLRDGHAPEQLHNHNDRGWNAINYAYILELEAVNVLEETGGPTGYRNFAPNGLMESQQVRIFILEQFLDEPFGDPRLKSAKVDAWVIATIAEAYFGLCRYTEALRFIEEYKLMQLKSPWELRSFGQQLYSIAYLQQVRDKVIRAVDPPLAFLMPDEAGHVSMPDINRCLSALDIKGDAKVEIAQMGKSGLALSGGGFRASLFHIGVLAALAERDELKHIEVISCVSGGSIIGAYYYLKLKLLLESKKDGDITRQDYIDLVKEVEEGFLKGVQKNLRMRIFSNLGANFRMQTEDYSRTNRIGELYEEYLYKPIFEARVKKLRAEAEAAGRPFVNPYKEITGPGARPICMTDLFINPDEHFVFDTDNWKRANKVPQLILNATSVNTGHNWQFTASWMGEPASGIVSDIDVKSRLRRMYYHDAPEKYQQFRLGYAVGASSCVPVMFEPLPLKDLYPGIDLQLIDGGLHDNQGIASILEEECKNVFISDASAQLPTNENGVSSSFSLFMRSDNILQERLRELQFLDMKERRNTTLINRLHHVHLKNGITKPSVNWKNCTDPPRTISHSDPYAMDRDLMPYGVLRNIQQRISEIRTDLDAFHDTEAYALMYDGYKQTHYELGRGTNGTDGAGERGRWDFLAVEEFLKDPAKAEEIDHLLAVSSKVPLKLLSLIGTPAKVGLMLPVLAVVAALGWWIWTIRGKVYEISVGYIAVLAILLLLGIFLKPIAIVLQPKKYIRRKLEAILLAIVAWISFNAYLICCNGWYLRLGKLKKQE